MGSSTSTGDNHLDAALASLAYSTIRWGAVGRDNATCFNTEFFTTTIAPCIVGKSESLPMMMPISG